MAEKYNREILEEYDVYCPSCKNKGIQTLLAKNKGAVGRIEFYCKKEKKPVIIILK